MMENDDKQFKDARELEILTMQHIMKTENGRAFLWRCLQNCGTFDSMFNSDATQHNFNAGKRSHGLWLDEELREANEDNYYLMLKENR